MFLFSVQVPLVWLTVGTENVAVLAVVNVAPESSNTAVPVPLIDGGA